LLCNSKVTHATSNIQNGASFLDIRFKYFFGIQYKFTENVVKSETEPPWTYMFFSDKYFIEDVSNQALLFNSIQEYNRSIAVGRGDVNNTYLSAIAG
jgi:hypothetical protein